MNKDREENIAKEEQRIRYTVVVKRQEEGRETKEREIGVGRTKARKAALRLTYPKVGSGKKVDRRGSE